MAKQIRTDTSTGVLYGIVQNDGVELYSEPVTLVRRRYGTSWGGSSIHNIAVSVASGQDISRVWRMCSVGFRQAFPGFKVPGKGICFTVTVQLVAPPVQVPRPAPKGLSRAASAVHGTTRKSSRSAR